MKKISENDGPRSARTMIVLLASAVGLAAVILLAAVLPAEYGYDPTGLGKRLGTDRLWAPDEVVQTAPKAAGTMASRSFARPYRSHELDILLEPGGDPERRDEIEYKVNLPKGASAVYSWRTADIDRPDEFYTEFHGHTLVQGKAMTVAYYRKATGTSDNGVVTAPFAGVHGWYFQNQSERPVKIHLKIAGFYDLVPPGQPGNEAGLVARPID